MRNTVLALALMLLCAGCDSSTEPGHGAVQGLGPPVARGLFLMDEAGNALGTWRRPIDGGLRSLPNPSGGTCTIFFTMQREGRARMWVAAALPPEGAEGPQTAQAVGGRFLVGGGVPVVPLLDQDVPAGDHAVAFNMNGAYPDGPMLPTGFYRIFLETPEGLFFVDHFGQSGEDYWLPAGLEDLLY